MKKGNYWFTLVELIVVIAILAVLWTIAFVSFQGYARDSRDSVRISDIRTATKTLDLFAIQNGHFPQVSSGTQITYNGDNIFDIGVLGADTIQISWWLSEVPVDPSAGLPYAYGVTENKLEYQLAWIFEWTVVKNLYPLVSANSNQAMANIKGRYNEKVLSMKQWTGTTLLHLPSMIINDNTITDIQQLVNSGSLVLSWQKNLPYHFQEVGYQVKTNSGVIAPNPSYLLAYSWDLRTLLESDIQQVLFLNRFENAYTGTVLQKYAPIQDVLEATITSTDERKTLVTEILTNSFAIEIQEISKFLK